MTRWLYPICALALTLCLCKFVLDADRAMRQAKDTLFTISNTAGILASDEAYIGNELRDPDHGLNAELLDMHRTELIAGRAITNIEKGTRTWQQKQNSLADQSQIVLTDTQSELRSLTRTTDLLSQSIQEQNSNLSRLQSTASDSLSKMGTLSDSLDNAVIAISSNAEQASKNLASVTHNLDLTSHDFQQFVHRETAPAKGFYNTAKEGVDWAWKIKSLIF